jgi:hypothetical protein
MVNPRVYLKVSGKYIQLESGKMSTRLVQTANLCLVPNTKLKIFIISQYPLQVTRNNIKVSATEPTIAPISQSRSGDRRLYATTTEPTKNATVSAWLKSQELYQRATVKL